MQCTIWNFLLWFVVGTFISTFYIKSLKNNSFSKLLFSFSRNICLFYQYKHKLTYLFSENKNSMLEAEIWSLQRRLVRRDNDILKQKREPHKLRVAKQPSAHDFVFFLLFHLYLFSRWETRPYSKFASILHVHSLKKFAVPSLY